MEITKLSVKAFGKFSPKEFPKFRDFEVALKIHGRDGPLAWRSSLYSVQNLLNHLGRYTKSKSSREKYLRHLLQFCRWSDRGPEELVRLPSQEASSLVQAFADELAERDRSNAYVNSVIKRLRTFFRVNGHEDLKVATYFVPTRYRKTPEYVPTKQEVYSMADAADSRRDRAIILTLWSSGLRVSTLCALNYSDVAGELNRNYRN